MSPKPASTIVPDTDKTREQLLSELEELRTQVAILRDAEAKSKSIAEALRESEERFHLAQHVARTGTFEWNIQTGVNKWTPELEAMYGLSRGGFPRTYEAWRQLVYPEDLPEVERRAQEALEKGSFEGEWRVVWPDGSVHWIQGRGFAFKDELGKPLRLIGVNIDITKRKRAEEALRESEARRKVAEAVEAERKRLFEVLETLPAMICLLTSDYRVVFANRSFREKFGETHGRHCYEYCFGRTEPCEFCECYIVLKTGRPHRWEVTMPDGRVLEAYDIPFTDVDGSPMILEMDIDITERKRAVEALRESEEKFRVLADTSIAAFLVYQGENFVYVNDTAERVTGYSKEELLKMKYWSIVHPDFQEIVRKRGLARQHGEPEPSPYEIMFITKGGEARWIELSAGPIMYMGKPAGVATFFDITERKRADEALKAAKQQAELYVDLMGHDINNLHQIALGYLELAMNMPSGEEQAAFLDKPVEVLQRSAKLISNVRKLQKLQEGMFQDRDVDVCEVLSDVHREFGAVPNKTIKLNLNGYKCCHVRANELLRDVFSNLVGNAIKHTGDRADIIMDLDIVNVDGGRYCRVIVEDDGLGIPDDFKAKIFNRTLKGTDKEKGIGLGLYLVKSLVDNYNGRVWVEDRVLGDHTKGARFVVVLPAIEK